LEKGVWEGGPKCIRGKTRFSKGKGKPRGLREEKRKRIAEKRLAEKEIYTQRGIKEKTKTKFKRNGRLSGAQKNTVGSAKRSVLLNEKEETG